MDKSVGKLLFWTGVLHQAVGLAMGHRIAAEIVLDGYCGAIETDPMRSSLFWFFAAGVGLMIAGSLLRELELRGGVPVRFGWGLLTFGLVGGLAIPASGFWLLVVLGVMQVHQSRRRSARLA